MWKRCVLLCAGLVVAGCSSTSSDKDKLKECSDGPGGTHYFVERNEMCCGGAGVIESDLNCGSCGNACVNGNHCVGGECVCDSTGEFCSLSCAPFGCVDSMTNPEYCGFEAVKCDVSNGQVCSKGRCMASCTGNLDNCDGHCVDLENDAENCGSCGHKCPGDASSHVQRSYCLNRQCYQTCVGGYVDEDDNLENGCEHEVTFECGNGIVEIGERCDGGKLNDETCASVVGGGSTGTLLCRPDCLGFDTSDCSPSTTCGNGVIDGAEVCDGNQLGGASCASIVGQGSTGYLACNGNCSGFDTTYCTASTTCGNKSIDTGEACDGDLINGATCESVVGKGSEGTLKCAENCSGFDKSGCTAASVCGNKLLESGEECDGTNFNGKTCESLVGKGSKGSLTCNGCTIFTENCSSASTCGNNVIDGKDVCDGTALNNATCESVVGSGSNGTLSCRDNCTGYDVSGCTAAAQCGNGIIEEGETCDGTKLNDQTCESIVGPGSMGALRCNSTCTGYVTSGCSASTTCGNGILEAGEICDTTNVQGKTCESEVGEGSTGVVLCGSDCKQLNLSGCSAPTQCGNNKLDEGEICEIGNLNGATCESVVGKGSTGNLNCGAGCRHFDVSGCSKSKFCGDGEVSDTERCDGENLAGRTCADVVGYGSKGVLKCKNNCMGFDTSGCTPEVKCGNGKLDAGETCDGEMINGATCSALVGVGSTGSVLCNDSCSGFVTTKCSEPIKCGNGKLDEGETCDGALLNGMTCELFVGHGSTGTPGCNATCTGFTVGNCSPEVLCGNGRLDRGELCDTTLLNNATCESVVGFGSTGVLLCDSNCRFNTENCSAPQTCGNGTLDELEECDTTKFANNITSCRSYNTASFSSGKLKCNANCQVDISDCVSWCGNGEVNKSADHVTIGEVCDGTNLNKQNCEKIVGAGSTGTLKCTSDCKAFDTSDCTAAAFCGDNRINQASETCDGTTFPSGSDDCAGYSSTYSSGKLICLGNCTIDTSNCVRKPYCGDNELNNSELCDGKVFKNNDTLCAAWDDQYSSGTVSCNSDCTINYSKCVKKPTVACGNGKLDTGEYCDGNVYIHDVKTCSDWSSIYNGGTLGCTSDCQIDDSKCKLAPKCGNGFLDDDEECDGTKFTNKYCKNLDATLYSSGQLKCTSDCKLDVSACVSYCGNNTVNKTASGITIGEVCDGTNLDGKTCEKVMGAGYTGTLSCASDCKSFITSGCVPPANVPVCGDGKINQDSEWCDGNDFLDGTQSCTYWNGVLYTGGNVSCNDKCEFDFSSCIKNNDVAICGDGKINQTNEECDGSEVMDGLVNCSDWSDTFGAGRVGCDSNCEVTYNDCVLSSMLNCGNGVMEGDEECDKNELLFENCTDISSAYASGKLTCTDDCHLSASSCVVHRCGDGVLSADEFCDGSLFFSGYDACYKVDPRHAEGTLSCTNTCEIDDSNCSSTNLAWCTFHHFELSNHIAYGRVLLPTGKSADDVLAYLACTQDLSKPIGDWDIYIMASANPNCGDCGNNTEYFTESSYAGKPGTNYCAFIFEFSDIRFACFPKQTGESVPADVTTITNWADYTRPFTPDSCNESTDDVRCGTNESQICEDGFWQHFDECLLNGTTCDPTSGECI